MSTTTANALFDGTKVCRVCAVSKPLESFYRHHGMRDGRLHICKACKIVYQHQRMLDGHTRPIDAKRYYANPERQKQAKIKARIWAANNPLKRKAQYVIGNAIRNGTVRRGECEECGQKAHAHHDDYKKPLDVRWFCPVHHARLHKKIGSIHVTF